MKDKIITNILKYPLTKILKSIGSEIDQIANNKLLEHQVNTYKRSLYVKTILYRSEPVNLMDIYYPIKLEDTESIKGINKIVTINNGNDLFKKNNCITITGYAGSGKSMLLKYLFVKIADEKEKIPIRIELRYLEKHEGSFETYIKNLFNFSKIAKEEKFSDRLLASGNFVFLLDGFDELNAKTRYKVIKEIDNFIEKFSNNKYVITTRPYVNIELLPLFKNLNVRRLDNKDIYKFIKQQLPKQEHELADKIISSLKTNDNKFGTFLQNPLLLSMFILTFQSYSTLPSQRHIFYSQVIETLFNSHDSLSKLGYEREKESGLNREEFNTVLNVFSFLTIFENKLVFNKTYFRKQLIKIKERFPNLKFNNDKLLNDLLIALCLINKEGFHYSFVHKSIQEYFAAEYIAGLSQDNKEKVYEKLYQLFIIDDQDINIGLVNYISILIELDYENVYNLLIFKVFDFLISRHENLIKANNNNDEQKKLIIITNIFILNQFFCDFFEFKEQKRIRKSYNKIEKLVKINSIKDSIKEEEKFSFHINIDDTYGDKLEKLLNKEKSRILETIKQKNKSENRVLDLI
ncbi:NACHT domain-containing protein [Tenacibaculum aiptasiae]|uniref:NACHT domain-containing protein n=1 Tax=Tenacibaculum aiptasiae TaxID=426481 RepID=A0A7J5AMI6_9FLAO|nr:NACHT domain-containing protein [Tenacibaculum aiptasiae]KAB1158824.1 NACHT domain-containing protein [Tenacibaculum aiptasiae]